MCLFSSLELLVSLQNFNLMLYKSNGYKMRRQDSVHVASKIGGMLDL